LEAEEKFYLVDQKWDELINREELHIYLKGLVRPTQPGDMKPAVTVREIAEVVAGEWLKEGILPPIGSQEVWAAGVTYLRSRDARMEESRESGAASFYDKVYEAERPELFFKSQPHRVAAHGEPVYIRRDSTWNVPEPELALFINSKGRIQAYTIGNDMSSRSIEGENPLYLPQAKVYERSAALGPCLYVPGGPISPSTLIQMSIRRGGKKVFAGEIGIDRIKRSLTELASWLYSESDFIYGCFLMTGTCIVPTAEFTLAENDEVEIQIDGIGTLLNHVSYKPLKA
jgi:2-dehydro-3-deoxy-D-arabinonate dehydratase